MLASLSRCTISCVPTSLRALQAWCQLKLLVARGGGLQQPSGKRIPRTDQIWRRIPMPTLQAWSRSVPNGTTARLPWVPPATKAPSPTRISAAAAKLSADSDVTAVTAMRSGKSWSPSPASSRPLTVATRSAPSATTVPPWQLPPPLWLSATSVQRSRLPLAP